MREVGLECKTFFFHFDENVNLAFFSGDKGDLRQH